MRYKSCSRLYRAPIHTILLLIKIPSSKCPRNQDVPHHHEDLANHASRQVGLSPRDKRRFRPSAQQARPRGFAAHRPPACSVRPAPRGRAGLGRAPGAPDGHRPRRIPRSTARVLHLDDALYLSSPSTLTQAAASLPDSAQTGLIIAHNPGQEEWIRELTGARISLPTAGLAAVELGIHSWREISRGRLLYFVVPRLVKAITQRQ